MLRIAPGSQILFDAFRRGRVRGLQFVGLELLAVFPIHDPFAGGFQMFARRDRGGVADDRHQIRTPFDLHLEDRKPVLGIVVGHSFDESGQGFGHGSTTATPHASSLFSSASTQRRTHRSCRIPQRPRCIPARGGEVACSLCACVQFVPASRFPQSRPTAMSVGAENQPVYGRLKTSHPEKGGVCL